MSAAPGRPKQAHIAGAADPARVRPGAVLALMLASGFAGLGYQIVWTQQSALWLGHETAGVLAVVAAFFGGLGAGAMLLARRIAASDRPGRWYAGCELLIGVWSLVLATAMAPIGQALLRLIGAQPSAAWQWAVAFGGSFLLLLPATAAMGATLPAMERALARHWRHWGDGSIAALYAGNTFGAVLGVLTSAFWLVPAYGLARTALVCAALNLLCAAAALWLFDRRARAEAAPVGPDGPDGLGTADVAGVAGVPGTAGLPGVPGVSGMPVRRLLPLLAATGLLGIGYEVLVVRVLSQVAENTVYTFALLLAVYLVGSATGAAFYDRRLAGRVDAALGGRLGGRLMGLLALACMAGTASLYGAEAMKLHALALLGASMAAALGAEAGLAVVAFLPATLLMGALFSHLATQARAAGIGFGLALGVNTLGAALAPLLFGLLLLPALGAKAALLSLAAGYLLLAWWVGRPRVRLLPITFGAGLLALALLAPPLAFVSVPEGGRLLSYREGAMAAVSVVEERDGTRRLRINNRQQEGSNAAWSADARQALLPLLLHPAPQRALFLGLGTGTTAAAALLDPALQVEAVELLPEVVEAAAWFAALQRDPGQRLQIVAADARRFVRATPQQYDLIVSDNFHPARSGSAALYTVEHFDAVRERLAEGGLFCQWLPLHQLDLPTVRSIVRAFVTAFPGGGAVLATHSLETPVLGLVGHADGQRFQFAQLSARMASASQWPRGPAGLGLPDEVAVLGALVAGPQALQRLAGDAMPNTDDHPVVAYLAPHATYAPAEPPRALLTALLAELSAGPQDMVDAEPAAGARLAAYWAARTRFLMAGRDVRPSHDVRQMLAQVQQPLLDVLRTSPDFRPAYDPLLQMALALARDDSTAAQALLVELARLQPARPEAGDALRRLAGAPR